MSGKVAVNRSMWLAGFIAGPGHSMDWGVIALSPTSWHRTMPRRSRRPPAPCSSVGDGIRFSSPGIARTDLEPLSSTRSGDATILRFRVRKQFDHSGG